MAARCSKTGTRSVQEGMPASRSSAAAHVTLITHSASVSPSPEEPEEAIAGSQDEAALIHSTQGTKLHCHSGFTVPACQCCK